MMERFIAPKKLDEALDVLAEPSPPVVLAGGTDLWPQWTAGAKKPQRVISLHRLDELRQIERTDGCLRIGACVTHSELVRSELVAQGVPSLAEAAATVGAVQIQNRGTIGGNIANASPAADLPPPLLAANAEVELHSSKGARRVPLARFYRGYRDLDRAMDELLVAIHVPMLSSGTLERFRKIGTRRAQAISKVVGACRLTCDSEGRIEDAHLAFGSVAPVPILLDALGEWLIGKKPDDETRRAASKRASEAVRPIDDVRSSAHYRRHVLGQMVAAWLSELL